MLSDWLDLTHPISHGMQVLEVLPAVEVVPVLRLSDGAHVNSGTLAMSLHAGTHIDAPSHVLVDGHPIDEVSPTVFDTTGVVARVRHRRAGEEITLRDVLDGGPKPDPGEILFIDSGWCDLYGSPEYTDHPSLSEELATWVAERGVQMVAVDFISPDVSFPRRATPPTLVVHHILLQAGVLIAENLANLGKLPADKFRTLAVPLIIQGADAAPARFLAESD